MSSPQEIQLEELVTVAGGAAAATGLPKGMIITDATAPLDMSWLRDPRVIAARKRMGAPPVRR